jgi:hypothetical protein
MNHTPSRQRLFGVAPLWPGLRKPEPFNPMYFAAHKNCATLPSGQILWAADVALGGTLHRSYCHAWHAPGLYWEDARTGD